MAIPDWIEITGKLGPLSVALAVYVSTRSQNRWQNRVSARAAAVEDQKLRLAMLERRSQAVEDVRAAAAGFLTEGEATNETTQAMIRAFRAAELVFDKTEERKVDEMLALLHDWQMYNRRVAIYEKSRAENSEEKRQAALDELWKVQDRIFNELPALRALLVEATRISLVPALEPPQTWFQRIIAGRWPFRGSD